MSVTLGKGRSSAGLRNRHALLVGCADVLPVGHVDILPNVATSRTLDDHDGNDDDNDDIVNNNDDDDNGCIATPLSAATTAEEDCDSLGAARNAFKRERFAAESVNVSSGTTAKASCRVGEVETEAETAKASCEADADPALAKLSTAARKSKLRRWRLGRPR